MDTNPISEGFSGHRIEVTDDVEGHVTRGRGVEGPDTDDVEGHGTLRGSVAPDESADVEGHGAYSNRLDGPDTDDDTEGHGVRPRI